MKAKSTDLIMQNKVFAWLALGTVLILTVPLIAMQFSHEWNWSLSDFIVMGILLFGMGFAFVYVARVTPRKYRTVVAIAFSIAFLYIWAELAVGIFMNLGD